MVYYYTSKNVKLLRNILKDYEISNGISACEYMKKFIENSPETMEDAKISWFVETFLSMQKHEQLNEDLKSYLSKELSVDDQDYFIIMFNAILLQITPKDTDLLYKSLFNLGKNLLNIFTTFLCDDGALTLISHIAQPYYDINFITEKIIGPLFTWQPFLREMDQKYIQYVKKIEGKKIKPPTLPISPKVLNRNFKTNRIHSLKESLPETPPNSISKKTIMLTKSKLDQKIKEIHELNKQKALNLLQTAKSKESHYVREKPKCLDIGKVINNKYKKGFKVKANLILNSTPPIVKETTTTLKRIDKRIKQTQKEEIQWLEDLMVNCRNTTKVEELEDIDRQERERERLLDIEKKHLLGQISHEEAVLAKKKLMEENKKKYEDFMKEKRLWEEEINGWKRNEMEKNRKQVEKLSLLELDMLHAKHNNIAKKRENAESLKKESEELLAKAVKEKQDELENKIKIIKELKILSMVAKKVKVPKIIDLTESSGLGLLCEMSISELQEKLNMVKISLKEELDKKRKNINEQKEAARKNIEETKKSIAIFMIERANLRKQNKTTVNNSFKTSSKEINELKRVLEEKRNLRIKLST